MMVIKVENNPSWTTTGWRMVVEPDSVAVEFDAPHQQVVLSAADAGRIFGILAEQARVLSALGECLAESKGKDAP